MNCIKTGAIIFNRMTQMGTSVDLFINNGLLYINQNVWTPCDETRYKFDIIVDDIDECEFKNDILINPEVSDRLLEYVNHPYGGLAEAEFLRIYGKK